MEEQMKQTEIDQLQKMEDDIADSTIGKNPLYEKIIECE